MPDTSDKQVEALERVYSPVSHCSDASHSFERGKSLFCVYYTNKSRDEEILTKIGSSEIYFQSAETSGSVGTSQGSHRLHSVELLRNETLLTRGCCKTVPKREHTEKRQHKCQN